MHILLPGTPVEIREVEIRDKNGVAQWLDLKKLVEPLLDGGNLEHVRVLWHGQYRDMFVDDVGQLKDLPHNESATAIYRANWLQHHPGTDPETLPDIVGPAVLFDDAVWK